MKAVQNQVTMTESIKFYLSVFWRSTIYFCVLGVILVGGIWGYSIVGDSDIGNSLELILMQIIRDEKLLDFIVTLSAVAIIFPIISFFTYIATKKTVQSCTYKTFIFDKNIDKCSIIRYALHLNLILTLYGVLYVIIDFFFDIKSQISGSDNLLVTVQTITAIVYSRAIMNANVFGVHLPVIRIKSE